MNQDRTKRKLSAILSADVVGYSRLMEADDAWTIQNLEENKTLISRLVDDYKGRVVDAPGDNLLAEFISVINAVECAVKIQQELKRKYSKSQENHRMAFRIGINLGEVVEEDGRIYGSGVNIAARIEGLAQPGGICISRNVYDQVKTKLKLEYEYLGEHSVKNISDPVRVYHILTDSETAGKADVKNRIREGLSRRMAVSAVIIFIIIAAGVLSWRIYHHRPTEEAPKSIAVLPFVDLSPEKDQEYFVDGLSEEIGKNLMRIPRLKVIGRTSSFAFKGTHKTAQEIGDTLGASHILEGSVRKAGDTFRIIANLINTSDGIRLWSETYDREFKDIFEIQEDIANSVADKLKLTLESLKSLGGTDNIKAYELYLVARGQLNDFKLSQALESIDAAIALDSEFVLAWALKSQIHIELAGNNSADRASLEFNTALDAVLKAIELDPKLGQAHLALGAIHRDMGKFFEAEKAYRKGMDLITDPSDYYGYGLETYYGVIGYLRQCHELLDERRQNDPLDPSIRAEYMLISGYLGDTEKAEDEYEHGKAIFGDQWDYGHGYITVFRLGAKEALSISEIPELPLFDPIWAIAREHIETPDKGLAELRRIYHSDDNISSNNLINIALFAAYFGDSEFALDAMEKSLEIRTTGLFFYWSPVFHDIRQLPRFKKLLKKVGLVDYWKEYDWPDLCRPLGDGDFECD